MFYSWEKLLIQQVNLRCTFVRLQKELISDINKILPRRRVIMSDPIRTHFMKMWKETRNELIKAVKEFHNKDFKTDILRSS